MSSYCTVSHDASSIRSLMSVPATEGAYQCGGRQSACPRARTKFVSKGSESISYTSHWQGASHVCQYNYVIVVVCYVLNRDAIISIASENVPSSLLTVWCNWYWFYCSLGERKKRAGKDPRRVGADFHINLATQKQPDSDNWWVVKCDDNLPFILLFEGCLHLAVCGTMDQDSIQSEFWYHTTVDKDLRVNFYCVMLQKGIFTGDNCSW